jgi:hypothetical protein
MHKGQTVTIERPFIRGFNFLARMLGVIWVLGGVLFLLGAFIAQRYQLLFAGVGTFLLVAGIALLAAKSVTHADSDKVRHLIDRIKARRAE